MGDAAAGLKALLTELAQKRGGRIAAKQLAQFRNLPRAVVLEGVQEGFYRILRAYAARPDCPLTLIEAEKLLHIVVMNVLRDAWNKIQASIYDDPDYRAVRQEAQAISQDTAAARAEFAGEGALSSRQTRRPRPSFMEKAAMLEDALIDKIDGDRFISEIMSRLDEKYRRVCILLLDDMTPTEMGAKVGHGQDAQQEGLVLRRWARVKICRILAEMARRGHEMAARVREAGKCESLLRSAKISEAG